MFSDFDKKKTAAEGRGRMGVSFALSAVVYTLLAAGIAAAVATARAVVREREVRVEFAAAPPAPELEIEEEEAPPPPPKPRERAQDDRQATDRSVMDAPTVIPDETPDESEGELVAAENTGPLDGSIDGGAVEEPPPRPPRQRRETVRRPRFLSGCQGPMVPDEVIASAETVRILVRILIGPDGKPMDATVLQGHPMITEQSVVDCALAQVFEPARLPDGTAVPYPYRRRFVFRPANL